VDTTVNYLLTIFIQSSICLQQSLSYVEENRELETSAQSILAKGRITSPSKVTLPVRDLDSHLCSLDPHESAPKRHLDWFSRFCTAHPCAKHADRQTDRQTHRPRYVRHL